MLFYKDSTITLIKSNSLKLYKLDLKKVIYIKRRR